MGIKQIIDLDPTLNKFLNSKMDKEHFNHQLSLKFAALLITLEIYLSKF